MPPPNPQISNNDLEDKLIRLEAKVDLMIIRTDELILAYNTAKGVTVFIKWLAGLVTAGGIVWTTVFGGKLPHP
jgi:hypothetical protein